MTISANTTVGESPEHEEDNVVYGWAWDDANNKMLDPKMVQDARREEMKYINDKQVWIKISRAEAIK